MAGIDYTPPISLEPFLLSDKFVSLVIGPIGSGKTAAQLMKIAYEAQRMSKCIDGVRRSRCVIIRNTRQIINDSTLKDLLKWFPDGDAGTYHKTDMKFDLKFGDVECEILLRGLDTVDDTRRLLSTQFSFAVIEEFRELDPELYKAVAGRVGRYPDKLMVPPKAEWGIDSKGNPIGGCVDDYGNPMKKVFGASNPPDFDTFWEELVSNPPDNMSVTIQPSGLSPEADWVKYLDSGYYESLMELHKGDQAWIDINIHAQFGKSLSGKPVVRIFDRSTHVSTSFLIPNPYSTLGIGYDPGMNSALILGQMDGFGRLLVFDEIVLDGYGAERMCNDKLIPLLNQKYRGYEVIIAPDPAAGSRSQTNESSVVDVIRQSKFKKYWSVKIGPTNLLTPRLDAVDHFTSRLTERGPALLIDPRCKTLIKALAGGWKYEKTKSGSERELPEKNIYSHPADAFGYLAQFFQGGHAKASRRAQSNVLLPRAVNTYNMR